MNRRRFVHHYLSGWCKWRLSRKQMECQQGLPVFRIVKRLPEDLCDKEQLFVNVDRACDIWISPLNDRTVTTRLEKGRCQQNMKPTLNAIPREYRKLYKMQQSKVWTIWKCGPPTSSSDLLKLPSAAALNGLMFNWWRIIPLGWQEWFDNVQHTKYERATYLDCTSSETCSIEQDISGSLASILIIPRCRAIRRISFQLGSRGVYLKVGRNFRRFERNSICFSSLLAVLEKLNMGLPWGIRKAENEGGTEIVLR
jgi:hypothetical protein